MLSEHLAVNETVPLTYETRWSDDLVFKLLNSVEDIPEIRQGLYPGTGANASTASGGGKTKTEFYWQLATHVFTDHEEYGMPFLDVQKSSSKKTREPWVMKVKNQLNRYEHRIRWNYLWLLI